MNAGSRIEKRRLELGLSQGELANRIRKNGGEITQTGIDKLEKRDSKRPRYLAEIAKVLNVSQEWLLDGKDRPISAGIDRQLGDLPPETSAKLIAEFNSMIKTAKLLGKIGD